MYYYQTQQKYVECISDLVHCSLIFDENLSCILRLRSPLVYQNHLNI